MWLVTAPYNSEPHEAYYIGRGHTVVGYMQPRRGHCLCQMSKGRVTFQDCVYGTQHPDATCTKPQRVLFKSSPWGQCMFCGKTGKIGGRVMSHEHAMLGLHRGATKQVRTEESLISGEYDSRIRRCICRGCDRRLDNIRSEFLSCHKLIRKMELPSDQIPDSQAAATAAADDHQDDARSADLTGEHLRRYDGKAHHHE